MSTAQNFQKKKEYTKKEHDPIVTAKGTKLPLLDMRGNAYLQVAYRLVWFREEKPDWRIETELLTVSDRACVARAKIFDNQGNLMSTAHKSETVQGFADFIEKSETGAVGRALALIGYGTQFAPDLDEAERVVDAPIAPAAQAVKSEEIEAEDLSHDLGGYVFPIGRRYKGIKLKDINPAEFEQYLEWLKGTLIDQNKPANSQTKEAIEFSETYLKSLRG